MKKKTITFVVGLLMFVSLISVGFASWIISTSTKQEAEGSFTVEEVVDARLGIEYKWVTPVYGDTSDPTKITGYTEDVDANNIHFGSPKNMNTSGAWLTNTDEKEEILDVYLQITFTNLKGTGYILDGAITLDYKAKNTVEDNEETTDKDETENPFNTLGSEYVKFAETNLDKIYLVSNTVTPEGQTESVTTFYLSSTENYAEDKVLATLEGNSATVVVKVSFEWGDKFDNENPYDFYNTNLNPSEATITEAINALQEIKKLAGQKFIVTITGKTNAA